MKKIEDIISSIVAAFMILLPLWLAIVFLHYLPLRDKKVKETACPYGTVAVATPQYSVRGFRYGKICYDISTGKTYEMNKSVFSKEIKIREIK